MESQDRGGAVRAGVGGRLRPLVSISTSLFGREEELSLIKRMLTRDNVRLLTLTGAGGAGKTRLAIAAAVRAAVDFPDGVSFVDLSVVHDSALVPASIAQQIGIQESGREPLEFILPNVIADRAILLVLDNLEHVLEAARFIAGLLAACPRLALLVTSRAPLHVRAEQVLLVRPLPLPDPGVSDPRVVADNPAVALFVDRGRARRPAFGLTAENVSSVVEICTRLDGLPLAIELAAAQLAVLSPATILERLQARAPFVLNGVADLPARHRTLRAAVASSYELLTAEQQSVFRWCGVFAGSFAAEAAADVFADGDRAFDVLAPLAALADNSLLNVSEDPDGRPRFRWLETIRSFAVDHLTLTGELAIAQRRHAEHYVRLAETAEAALTGPAASRTLDTLEREYDNLRAVLHWALDGDAEELSIGLRVAGALHRFWLARGHLGEARQWLERALPGSDAMSAPIRGKALNAAGVVAGLQGDIEQAEAWFQESLALWRKVGDDRRIAVTIGNLGLVAQNRGDLDRALDRFREAQHLYELAGDQRGIAISLGARAWLERRKGKDGEALPLLERSVDLFRELGDERSLANSLANLGHSSLALGNAEAATAYFTESLQLRQALGSTLAIAECVEGFAALASIAGRPRRAARLYGAAEALREVTGAKLLDLADSSERDRQVGVIRKRLGAQTFAAEWVGGRGISADEAARLALRGSRSDEPDEGTLPGSRSAPRGPMLTRREGEVAELIARGLTNRQAAERLHVAPRTIETHLEHIFSKLGVQTRAELAAWAARHELVPTGPALPTRLE